MFDQKLTAQKLFDCSFDRLTDCINPDTPVDHPGLLWDSNVSATRAAGVCGSPPRRPQPVTGMTCSMGLSARQTPLCLICLLFIGALAKELTYEEAMKLAQKRQTSEDVLAAFRREHDAAQKNGHRAKKLEVCQIVQLAR